MFLEERVIWVSTALLKDRLRSFAWYIRKRRLSLIQLQNAIDSFWQIIWNRIWRHIPRICLLLLYWPFPFRRVRPILRVQGRTIHYFILNIEGLWLSLCLVIRLLLEEANLALKPWSNGRSPRLSGHNHLVTTLINCDWVLKWWYRLCRLRLDLKLSDLALVMIRNLFKQWILLQVRLKVRDRRLQSRIPYILLIRLILLQLQVIISRKI